MRAISINKTKKAESVNEIYIPDTKFCIVWSAVIYNSNSKELLKCKEKKIVGVNRYWLDHSQTKNEKHIQTYHKILEKIVSTFIKKHRPHQDHFSYYLKLIIIKMIRHPLYHYRIVEGTLNGTPFTPVTDDEFTDEEWDR